MNKIKTILFYLAGVILITLLLFPVSSMYAGETSIYPNELGKDKLVYTIIENTSELSVLPVITISQTNITIFLPYDMPPNSFKIVFIEESTNTIVQEVPIYTSSGGGHSTTKTKIINNTIEKEVPIYITQENKTIEYQNQTIIKEKIIKTPTKWTWILVGGVLVVLIIYAYFAFKLSNKYNEKGGKENE